MSDSTLKPLIIEGKYAKAKVYATLIEDAAIEQITNLCNQKFVEGEDISVMPDVHSGKECIVGYTQTLRNGRICPMLVSNDIECGMSVFELGNEDIDLKKFDTIVNKVMPKGNESHEGAKARLSRMKELKCAFEVKGMKYIERSLGTIGGGNHFIEIDVDSKGNKYLVIHSGSRALGDAVFDYYKKLANQLCNHNYADYDKKKKAIIEQYKAEGRKTEIQDVLKQLKLEYTKNLQLVSQEYVYLSGEYAEDYLHDMEICKEFASLNRKTVAKLILEPYYEGTKSIDDFPCFETVHNYVDTKNRIIRKGAISAQKGEKVIIPINMRDGSIICIGRGNPDYNFSGPHGAGRKMSRTEANKSLTLEEFRKEMNGIYSSTVCSQTLDEAPMAYKTVDDIVPMLEGTCDIVEIIKPIYNYKSKNVRYGKIGKLLDKLQEIAIQKYAGEYNDEFKREFEQIVIDQFAEVASTEQISEFVWSDEFGTLQFTMKNAEKEKSSTATLTFI